VLELQRLRPDHERAIYEFEVSNREYFAASISDRGNDFFENFSALFVDLLNEQESGVYAFHALVEEDSTVVGRFNLYDIDGGTADVGYRVAERAAGRGVATQGLKSLLRIATELKLKTVGAAVSHDNVASRRVLEKVGFLPAGPTTVGGRDVTRYELDVDQS
jgi:ribosomal-protein-alanine N-acetyltransferase